MDRTVDIGGQLIKLRENPDGTFSAQAVIDGTDATGVNQVAGGTGARGWLSSIYNAITTMQARKIQDSTGTNTLAIASDGSIKTTMAGGATLTANLLPVPSAGTRVRLPNIPCREVTVIGLKTNQGNIFVGGVNVSASVYGVNLEGPESFTFAVANANQIYIDSSISGEGISYVAI